jgi:hypothetical protein
MSKTSEYLEQRDRECRQLAAAKGYGIADERCIPIGYGDERMAFYVIVGYGDDQTFEHPTGWRY